LLKCLRRNNNETNSFNLPRIYLNPKSIEFPSSSKILSHRNWTRFSNGVYDVVEK
jgi:hypothetical protein